MQTLSSYDYFYDFAWERLEDVLGLDRETGIPSYSPYIEYVEGCAFVSLFHMTKEMQSEYFGFTLSEIADTPEFAKRLLNDDPGKQID
jgi:hypothetical protein